MSTDSRDLVDTPIVVNDLPDFSHSLIIVSELSLQQARGLVDAIIMRARSRDNMTLVEIDAHPDTKELLAMLPEVESHQAEVHLKSARIWRANQNEKAKGKLQAATKALGELDLSLARGILRKIDISLLKEPELARYDELLLAVEARAIELEEIQSRLPASPPGDKQSRSKRFWKR